MSTTERPTLGQRGLGYLDGFLGLAPASTDDDYLLGYGHGTDAREATHD